MQMFFWRVIQSVAIWTIFGTQRHYVDWLYDPKLWCILTRGIWCMIGMFSCLGWVQLVFRNAWVIDAGGNTSSCIIYLFESDECNFEDNFSNFSKLSRLSKGRTFLIFSSSSWRWHGSCNFHYADLINKDLIFNNINGRMNHIIIKSSASTSWHKVFLRKI